jgi:predicted porin
MKNILLGTTGLVGAALLAASASAQTPKVTVGGFIDFQAGLSDDDLQGNTTRDYGFRNDSEISFQIDGQSDSGLGYGAVIDLEADVTADSDAQGLNSSRTYIYLDGGFGRVELGSVEGSSATMAIDADNIAVATGGINGAWTYFASATGSSFISTPELPAEHASTLPLGAENNVNAAKINYYSPRFSGFQLGLSYTPDLDDRGQGLVRSETGGTAGDVFDIALNYEGSFDQIDLGVSGVYTSGEGDAGTEDLRAWVIGAMLGYQGFSIAGSFADWDDSLMATGTNVDGDYYTLGAAYENGPFGVSATWIDSELDFGASSNDFNNLVIGADYKLAPGLTPYAEVSFYDFDVAGTTVGDNDGTVFILGTQLAF